MCLSVWNKCLFMVQTISFLLFVWIISMFPFCFWGEIWPFKKKLHICVSHPIWNSKNPGPVTITKKLHQTIKACEQWLTKWTIEHSVNGETLVRLVHLWVGDMHGEIRGAVTAWECFPVDGCLCVRVLDYQWVVECRSSSPVFSLEPHQCPRGS